MKKIICIALSFIMLATVALSADFSAIAESEVASVTIDGNQQSYTDIDAAWEAVQGKTATITLLSDATAGELYACDENNNITINFGTYAVNCSFVELEDGCYTLNGTTGGINASCDFLSGIVIGFEGSSNVTINGGIYSGAFGALSFSNSIVNLNGGTFMAGSDSSINGDCIADSIKIGCLLCSPDGTIVATHRYNQASIEQTVSVAACNHADKEYKIENNTHTSYCFDCDTSIGSTVACSFDAVVTPPSCTAAGYTTHTCICGNSYVDNEVAATNHSYGSWTHIDGTQTHKKDCVKGDDTITEQCSFEKVVTPETCANDGYTTFTCTVCGYTFRDNFTTATGNHTPTSYRENEVPSTCITEGSYDAVTICEVCGKELARKHFTIPTSGCTIGGYSSNGDGTHCPGCSVCNKKLDTTVEQCEYTVKKVAPTCTAKGYDINTCTKCGYTYKGNYTDKKPHTTVTDKAVAPTCTKTGKTQGSHCSVCKAVIVAQKTVKAKGHSYGSYSVTTAPTSKKEGVMTAKCKVCSAKKTKSIAKLATIRISTISAKSKGFTITWQKKSSETGYQIQYSTNKNLSNSKKILITKNSTTKKTFSKLKSKKKYYVRIRTYRTINGKKYYGSWSNTRYITTRR